MSNAEYIFYDCKFSENGEGNILNIIVERNQNKSFCTTISLFLFDFITLSTIDRSMQITEVGSFLFLTFSGRGFIVSLWRMFSTISRR